MKNRETIAPKMWQVMIIMYSNWPINPCFSQTPCPSSLSLLLSFGHAFLLARAYFILEWCLRWRWDISKIECDKTRHTLLFRTGTIVTVWCHSLRYFIIWKMSSNSNMKLTLKTTPKSDYTYIQYIQQQRNYYTLQNMGEMTFF